DGEAELQRGDASPGAREVPLLEAFELRHAWGVVGDDGRKEPFADRGPQALSVLVLADRRRAFEFRRAVGNRFGLEVEVVRGRLRRERHALVLRLAKQRQRAG